ncbi:MAG: hypothetical protein Q9171_002019 [Xanthocarpia ochracea]
MPAKSRHKPFFITQDKALKQIARQNSKSSPILRLPAELREKIYKELLGDRLIHIEYTHWRHEEYYPDRMATRPDPAFYEECHLSCVACLQEGTDSSKDSPLWDRCLNLCTAHPKPPTPLPYSWESVQVTPEPWPESRSVIRKPNERAIDGIILRSCRQIYNECHQVLYVSNTFSFNNPRVFLQFMQTVDTTNLRQIRRLQLYVNCNVNEEWHKANKYVMSMQGLRSLDLISTTDVRQPHAQTMIMDPSTLYGFFSFPLWFRILRGLQTVKVSVEKTDRVWDNSWTQQDGDAIAAILRDKIADPNGFQAHEEEYEQRQQARKRERDQDEVEKEEKRKRRREKEAEKEEKRQRRAQEVASNQHGAFLDATDDRMRAIASQPHQ